MRHCLRSRHLALAIGVATHVPLVAQKKPVTQPIVAAALAGQTVAVLPANLVIVEPTVSDTIAIRKRPEVFRWVDSMVTESFATRAPDVKWIPAPELRRIYKKSGGLL